MKIAVGSKNPVKITAVQQAFQAVWPEKTFEMIGIDVASSVSNQPMSTRESIRGARNRARKALKATGADFGVGLEGGLQKIGKQWFNAGWVVICNKEKQEGVGSSVHLPLSTKALALIQSGLELGDVDDIIFGQKNSKQGDGHFGLMTKNTVTRMEGYKDGVIMALTRFIHPHLFEA